MAGMKVRVDDLQKFCMEALTKVGLSETDARLAAEVMVTTDTWGVFTHGTKSLLAYVRRIRAGGIRRAGMPKVVREGPAWAMVDGDSALGMVVGEFAMRTAIAKARQSGISYVGVHNSCHFGAAGIYAARALEHDMIGLAMANDIPTVTAPGARQAVLGSNPIAFAVPAGVERPLLLDIATSTVAGGKVAAAAMRGEPIPNHWLVDGERRPTTDPNLFPHAAALTPMAGHKGYGLALLIETLSGLLTGAAVTWEVLSYTFADPSQPTGHGAAFLAVDIGAIVPLDQFKRRVDHVVREIRSAPGPIARSGFTCLGSWSGNGASEHWQRAWNCHRTLW